jgi:DNA-binding NarL/FixJ family response regulator
MRCLVVDDDPQDRELVTRAVGRAGHEAAIAQDGKAAVELAKNERFDVALVDLGMPGMDGVAVLKALRTACPDLRLLVVSGFDDRGHVLDAMHAGADGYVLKSEIGERLSSAIREVWEGGGPMSAKIARFVIEELRPAGARGSSASKSLSPRELEVLDGLSQGHTYSEIAKQLGISVNTVRHHIRNLYEKLDVTGKAEAVSRVLGEIKRN